MILMQRSTAIDPFLLKFVCHHFDSRPLRWLLRLFRLWNEEVKPQASTRPEMASDAPVSIRLGHFVSPITVRKVDGTRDVERRRRY